MTSIWILLIVLEPILSGPEAIATLPDHRCYVDGIYTPISLTSLVCASIPLDTKQRLVVEKVLGEALSWEDHPYDAQRRYQIKMVAFSGLSSLGKRRRKQSKWRFFLYHLQPGTSYLGSILLGITVSSISRPTKRQPIITEF